MIEQMEQLIVTCNRDIIRCFKQMKTILAILSNVDTVKDDSQENRDLDVHAQEIPDSPVSTTGVARRIPIVTPKAETTGRRLPGHSVSTPSISRNVLLTHPPPSSPRTKRCLEISPAGRADAVAQRSPSAQF